MSRNNRDDTYSDKETAKRRDEVIRRMANTPPQPKINPRPQERKTSTGGGRAAHRGRDDRED